MAMSNRVNTPARTSVTPARSVAAWAVGVDPTLTMGQGSPACRSAAAAATAGSRSCAAIACRASGVKQP